MSRRKSLPLSVVFATCCASGCSQGSGPGELVVGVARQAQQAAAPHAGCADHADVHDDIGLRERAHEPIGWRRSRPPGPAGSVAVRVLGINDFHGRLSEGLLVSGRPVGGAAVLAAHLKSAAAAFEGRSLLVHAGDLVGASPPESALLQDEPTLAFLNLLAAPECRGAAHPEPRCNVVGTLGNHEFDEGSAELLRLLYGGNHPSGPFLEDPYPGARFATVSANVEADGTPLLPRSQVLRLGGVRVGVIGAVLQDTPSVVTPSGVAGLQFLDEAAAINAEAAELEARGVQAIIVSIHQGAVQAAANDAPTDPVASVGEPIRGIVAALADSVDLVVSGHSHSFTNALVSNTNGVEILVTQAFANGTAYAEIDLELDRGSGDVTSKSARIVTTFSDQAPGDVRDPEVQALVDAARERVAPLVNRQVATIGADITRTQNAAGESALGNLIADAQRAATGADIALMNPGGIRADLLFAADPSNAADVDGSVSWGELFTVQPFGNSLVSMRLSGAQIVALLEQQWLGQPTPRLLSISGLSYTWDAAAPEGQRIVEARRDGELLDPAALYGVAANNFIATGGDGFSVFTLATEPVGGPIDLDALIDFLSAVPEIEPPNTGRITRLN